MSNQVDGGQPQVSKPWYADREVQALLYRVNRRPFAQGNLFASQPESFLDHLVECLLFGTEVETGRRHRRRWILGNRTIRTDQGLLGGYVGYSADEVKGTDQYNYETQEWEDDLELGERKARAPFIIVESSRVLAVLRHPTFSEGSIPVVFESLLRQGELEREGDTTTDWAVEPLLDNTEFQTWLAQVGVLDRLRFKVKLPNPDSADLFEEISKHLQEEDAELVHDLKPRDKARGLNKSLSDPMSQGLLEMARRSFARVTARGRSTSGRTTEYNQLRRVRRFPIFFAATAVDALSDLIGVSKDLPSPGEE